MGLEPLPPIVPAERLQEPDRCGPEPGKARSGPRPASAHDESLLPGPVQLLDLPLAPERGPPVRRALAVDRLHRETAPGVPGAAPGVMGGQATVEVIRHAGIEGTVG